MQRSQHTESHQNHERWLLTYADMITLLTAFFLMLYSMSVVSKTKFAEVAVSVRSGFGGLSKGGVHLLTGGGAITDRSGVHSNSQYLDYLAAMRNLDRYVEQHDMKGQVSTRSDERGVVISLISDNMLFERGQAHLSRKSDALLSRVAQVIKTVPNRVQIEGHTCNLPIHTAQFPSNWELSTARAGSVLRYFTERAGLPDKRFMAAGYADIRPLIPNTSESNRVKNRRVDIVLLKTQEQQEADLIRRSERQRILRPRSPQANSGAANDGAPTRPAGTNASPSDASGAASVAVPAERAGEAKATTLEP